MTRFIYSGPVQSVPVKTAAGFESVQLSPGKSVQLPADSKPVKGLIALGMLTEDTPPETNDAAAKTGKGAKSRRVDDSAEAEKE